MLTTRHMTDWLNREAAACSKNKTKDQLVKKTKELLLQIIIIH
jgi:hypothetical protein